MAGEAGRAAAAAALPERIAFLGLGLIGGSIALALRDAGYGGSLAAWTPGGRGPAEAARRGIVDQAAGSAEAALDGAGLVCLAGPPLAIIDDLRLLGGERRGALSGGATVTDVGSTKARIVAAADAARLPFVGGHPLAGRETTGVASATAELFVDRPWAVVPGALAGAIDIDRVEALARATGARPLLLSGDDHDAAVAAISHLPLVLAAALVEAVAAGPGPAGAWPTARQLAAGGWRDMTRLAKGDPEMGAGILATNAAPVAARLRAVRGILDDWIARLDAGDSETATPDPAELRRRLEAARDAMTDTQP